MNDLIDQFFKNLLLFGIAQFLLFEPHHLIAASQPFESQLFGLIANRLLQTIPRHQSINKLTIQRLGHGLHRIERHPPALFILFDSRYTLAIHSDSSRKLSTSHPQSGSDGSNPSFLRHGHVFYRPKRLQGLFKLILS